MLYWICAKWAVTYVTGQSDTAVCCKRLKSGKLAKPMTRACEGGGMFGSTRVGVAGTSWMAMQ